jgi:hypothetical protein
MSGGGSTTTTNQVKLPEWLNQGAQSVFSDARAAAAANPIQQYQGAMAPGSNQNLDTAFNVAQSGQGAGQGDLNAARALTGMAATSRTPGVSTQDFDSAQASRYMNPFLDQVQGRTIAEMQRQNQGELAGLGDTARGSRAFGGLRHAVLEGSTRGNQNRNMLDYLAQSNAGAFDDSFNRFAADRSSRQGAESTNAGIMQSDLMRMLQSGAQFGNLGQQAQGMRSNDINDLLRTGTDRQQTEGDQLEAQYREFLRMQDAPMQRYQQLMGMLTGAPTDRTETSTTRKKNSVFGDILGVAGLGASIFSDRRLKHRIVRIGELAGLPLYSFRYLWSNAPQMGFMADEVERIIPEAVGRAFGFKTVNIGKVLARG